MDDDVARDRIFELKEENKKLKKRIVLLEKTIAAYEKLVETLVNPFPPISSEPLHD